jgi:diacylglycerol kinase (ATP)
VHTLPAALKRLFGSSAYALHTTRTVFRYRYPPIRLRIDDLETSATSAIVSKGVLYGGRYRLALDAVPGEPGFSLALFDHAGPGRALLHGAALPANLLARAPWVRRFRARRIEFLAGTVPLPVQADGDRAGFTPLIVRDAPAPLQVVTP